MFFEEYLGHRIEAPLKDGTAVDGTPTRVPVRSFRVSVCEGSASPTSPSGGWDKKRFRSVASAREHIDTEILFAQLEAMDRIERGLPPDDSPQAQIWHRWALAQYDDMRALLASTQPLSEGPIEPAGPDCTAPSSRAGVQ